jgi:hypothetical protein
LLWDGNAYNANSDYTGPGGSANATVSSTAPWFGVSWTAHDVQMFLPGSYSFDSAQGGGNPEAGILNVSVGAGQLGMHLLWDWGVWLNIDLFMVFDQNSVFGSGIARSTAGVTASGANLCDAGTIKNCLYDGSYFGSAGKPLGGQAWMLASVDGDGDGIMGIPMMPGGPIAGFSWNLNANMIPTPGPIPIPAAAWLFGSGLLGLVGLARRRKNLDS